MIYIAISDIIIAIREYKAEVNDVEVNRRYKQLKKYGISRYRYIELQYFCLQYQEKKQSGGRANEYDIKMIEETAQEVSGQLYEYLMKNVAYGIRWDDIGAPCGRRQFYELRHLFFIVLNARQKNGTLSEQ